MGRLSVTKRLLFIALLVIIPYLAIEAIATCYGWFTWWDHSFAITEDTEKTIEFDAIRGYRLNSTPARTARITDGRFEYVGAYRGNSQGFPDRDDFGPKRDARYKHRFAVFGDSFTHAPYLSQNWPDRAEDIMAEKGEPVQFLNFALSYTGLANWWSILTRIVKAEDYDLDGVIFVVWETNLLRGFTVQASKKPHRPHDKLLFGRCRSWDPKDFPTTESEALAFLEEDKMQYLLPAEEFEQTLQGGWPASVPRHFRPLIATQIFRAVRALVKPAPPETTAETPGDFDAPRKKLIDDMRQFLESKKLPALVIHLPSRDTLLHPSENSRLHREKSKAFAQALGASFLDADELFAGMKPDEIHAQFLPHDGHWNQKGSNRFAEFVVAKLHMLARPHDTVVAGATK
jgi:hypothetical protein